MTDRLTRTARRVCTPRQLEVLKYHFDEGYSYRKIGRILGITPTTVRDHLEAAFLQIKKAEADQEDAA